MSGTPLYVGIIGFVTGIGVASVTPFSYPTLIWILGMGLVLALLWRKVGNQTRLALYASVGLVFFSLGAGRFLLASEAVFSPTLMPQIGGTVTVEGIVIREPDRREAQQQLVVRSSEDTLLVTVDRYVAVSYGDLVSVSGLLKAPEAFTTDLGRTFDYPGYLRARGIDLQMSFATLTVLESGHGNFILTKLLSAKEAFVRSLNMVVAEPASGLGAGLLLGVKSGLGDELEAVFRETGIIHIVVLSGYNIMLVVIFVRYLLSSVLSPKGQFIVGVLAISVFALVVGFSATVVRACIMAALLLMAEATGRHYLVLRALMVAGVGMLILNPYLLLYDIGFQLSFMATLGLILIAPHLERLVAFVPAWGGVRGFLLATVATQLAVLPLLMYHIGEVSLVATVVNVLTLPMVPVAMLLTFGTGLLGFVSEQLALILAVPAYASLMYIIEAAKLFAQVPLAAVSLPAFSAHWVLVAYAVLAGLDFLVYRHRENNFTAGNFSLARSTPSHTSVIDVSGWVIEEEKEHEATSEAAKSAAVRRTAAPEDTPIFFR